MGSGITREPVREIHPNGSLHRAIVVEQSDSLGSDAFPTALRAAIQASGLSLDRIQYRLRSRGVSVSVTALSYWQSGRRRPERAESLAALGHLESVLGVAPGSLMALLGAPRPAVPGDHRVPGLPHRPGGARPRGRHRGRRDPAGAAAAPRRDGDPGLL